MHFMRIGSLSILLEASKEKSVHQTRVRVKICNYSPENKINTRREKHPQAVIERTTKESMTKNVSIYIIIV